MSRNAAKKMLSNKLIERAGHSVRHFQTYVRCITSLKFDKFMICQLIFHPSLAGVEAVSVRLKLEIVARLV